MDDVQDTADKELEVAPVGLAAGKTFQATPFHDSAKAFEAEDPTAIQAVAEVQETPERKLSVDGFGVDWMLQVDPFQTSATVDRVPVLENADPTAMQAVAEVQEMLESELKVDPLGFGTDCMLQTVPSQDSAIGVCLAPPTAKQADTEGHETPRRLL